MSRLKEEESAIDNLALDELHMEQPSIEEINGEIVKNRLMKFSQING